MRRPLAACLAPARTLAVPALATSALITSALIAPAFIAPAFSAGLTDHARGNVPVMEETTPPPLANQDNSDVRRARKYAMQPPVIPHKVEGYQLDKNANRCMMCHARTRIQESQAPMVSVTHFMDRDSNFLAELSPRRYFCLQCHVPQAPLDPIVENRFIDVDTLLRRDAAAAAPAQPREKR